MAGQVEHEIKLRLRTPEAGREALLRLGARLQRPRHLEDNVVFDDSGGTLRGRGCLLRLRRAPDGARLTLKAPHAGAADVKSRDEVEVVLSDPEAAQTILGALGYRPTFRYQKYREAYAWGDVEILLDETPVGTFLEIEGPVGAIRETASALGFSPSDFITDSYVGMFFAAGGKGDMVFR